MLTPKQKQIFEYIKKYIKKNGYSPTQKEIGGRFGLVKSTVHQHIETLKEKGYLNKFNNQARAIEIVKNKKSELVEVPLLGAITAGQPIEAIEIPNETIAVSKNEIGRLGNYYALRVRGDSMKDEGIFDGDIVVIRKQETADDGQTVVAVIDDNEATLKKIYKEKSRIRLQPANQAMLPIYRKEVEVRGVVVKIVRNMETGEQDNTLAYKKKTFLNRIKSTNPKSQNKYKRVALSPIRYAGGKSLAVGHVVELLPENIKRVVSPFFGGGSIEISMSKELGLEVIGYDIFDILCNYWKFQIEKPELLYEKLKELKPNKNTFEKIRFILNDVWKKKIKLDPLTLAVYYVYNFNLSYGPGFMGWSSEIYLNDKRYKRMLGNIRDFDPKNLKVECADFQKVIKNHPDDFFYCDPPYYIGKDSKMFRGIYPMRNIPVHHKGFSHDALRDLLKNHKGGFILSYNNCPTIREYYKEFQQYFPTWQYTMGQGETRIGKNRIENGDDHIKQSHEIIIFSPPKNLLTIKEASRWASEYLKRDVSESNISYLVQYGKIKKQNDGGSVFIDADDLKNYYYSYRDRREIIWKNKLGGDLNWRLSFDHLREKDTTKHVHRLHPYKGKFIPQLVEYFIDNHIDDFKKNTYFKTGDVILDPFSGSGTTLVQAQEMGMHSIGIDVSHFNCMIAETKLPNYDIVTLEEEVKRIKNAVANYEADSNIGFFERELVGRLADFNNLHFPSPSFKYNVLRGQINEGKYVKEKEAEFLKIYNNLVKKYKIELNHSTGKNFSDRWYIKNVRKEINFAFEQVKKIKDIKNKKIVAVILSRTIRSCRATTHSDLATLKEPQLTTYYCWKHKKICKPLFSIKSWFERYAVDTVYRLRNFARLKTDAYYSIIPADSRTVNIFKEVEKRNKRFWEILKKQKIKGIFTSPPYVGQIDYHEQHAYAYDLFGFKRRDELEIGPLYNGQGAAARASYVDGVSKVLLNCRKYLADNFDVFLVANDKYNLYPAIAERAQMKIINQFKRPVLNRTERDKSPYSEIIFHLKSKI